MNGDFEYRDWGLLDRTHIRFFGLKNIEVLFAEADLKIIEAKYVIKSPEFTEFAASWSKLSRTMQEALKSSAHADMYQVVVKAVPRSCPGNVIGLFCHTTPLMLVLFALPLARAGPLKVA